MTCRPRVMLVYLVVALGLLAGLGAPRLMARAAEPPDDLRVALPWTPENLDPTTNLSSIRAAVGVSLFDSLVGRDTENRLVPQLAESWKRLMDIFGSRDRLAWTPRSDQWMRFQEAALK